MRLYLRYMPQLFFVVLALVTMLSLIPSAAVPQTLQFWDKAQHSLAYSLLAIIGSLAFPQRTIPLLLGLLAHGAVIEVMQSTLTTTRLGDVLDWFADGTGVLAGIGIYRYLLAGAIKP